ncbi:hypothetical protein NLG97_g2786 [Lecanicillium saksenae]|uniref:Uncharacterized protein n=1 Tax=Lecanicillium saksenae TaxID=468837 RepID=A0ACC1QZX7_9HYPO|nr:hypothetical protein NLG97_g2786 [Lecanicillium saksenae]
MAAFSGLPYEIRAAIWTLAVQPRTVLVSTVHPDQTLTPTYQTYSPPPPQQLYFSSPTPTLNLFHVCHESREHVIKNYQRICLNEVPGEPCFWIDFNIDILDIGQSYLEYFSRFGPLIRRIKLTRDVCCEAWFFECRLFVEFYRLVQCFVVAEDGWWAWFEQHKQTSLACSTIDAWYNGEGREHQNTESFVPGIEKNSVPRPSDEQLAAMDFPVVSVR